jgi:hypothetical protein
MDPRDPPDPRRDDRDQRARYGSHRYPSERYGSARGEPPSEAGSGDRRSSRLGRRDYDQSYRESESNALTRNMGGGPDLFEPTRGGGRYSRAGHGEELREPGTSYGHASGYAGGRRGEGQHEDSFQPDHDRPAAAFPSGRGDRGADYGGGGYGGNYRGHERSAQRAEAGWRNQGHGSRQGAGGGSLGSPQQDFGRGEGHGALGSGFPGEHASPSLAIGGWAQPTAYGPSPGLGEHRGRGPKSYRRSDERLKEDICERLTDDPHIDASGIEVEVDDGAVTLSGSIGNRWMKYHAEEIVDRCRGVHEIHNRLSCPRSGTGSRDDQGDSGSPRPH